MARGAKTSGRLEIRLLGELEVADTNGLLSLPQSRKTRALFAYLILTAREHRRDRLCTIFWDVTEDPRGALRWSLSKLRQIADGESKRIDANRTSVRFDSVDTSIDLIDVRKVARNLEAASVDDLESAAALYRGELLEGLELSDFDEFQSWLVAMREEALSDRVAIARELTTRLKDDPVRALPHARVLVRAAPIDETARALLVKLLWESGRHREAEAQVETGQRALAELSGRESQALRDLIPSLRATATEPTTKPTPSTAPPIADTDPNVPRSPLARTTIHGLRLIGRQAELGQLATKLDEVEATKRAQVAVIGGEPGVGKSRMLVSMIVEARKRRGGIVEGCAYEAESGRAYGPWIDALGRVPMQLLGEQIAAELAPLLGKGPAPEAAETKNRLFQSVVNLFIKRCSDSSPVLLALDDLQWFDEASLELLHYVVRYCAGLPMLIALTLRDGELADNLAAVRTIRGIRRTGTIEELTLGPLDQDETAQLVRLLQGKFDVEEVFRESGGNPLFALEVARSTTRAPSARSSLGTVVRDRIEGLPEIAADVLRWAAVLGPVFSVRTLRALVTADDSALGDNLDALERHALIGGVVDPIDPGATYQFSHHLVRRVVYGELSPSRRRLMHQKAVGVLRDAIERDDSKAVELLHHASEAGAPSLQLGVRDRRSPMRPTICTRASGVAHSPRSSPTRRKFDQRSQRTSPRSRNRA